MVPLRLATPAHRATLGAAALILAAACAGRDGAPEVGADEGADADRAVAERVRGRYDSPDVQAAGAWTWTSPTGATFVLVDLHSTIEGLVQARLDLWLVTDSAEQVVGRSDAMPSAAEIGAYTVDDLTGDGLPDLFGYVADSSAVRYPVFLPGARGGIGDELSAAAQGWRFEAEDPYEPALVAGMAGPCALQLWAEPPAPDGRPAGWRWLLLLREGRLAAPSAEEPVCP